MGGIEEWGVDELRVYMNRFAGSIWSATPVNGENLPDIPGGVGKGVIGVKHPKHPLFY